MRHLWGRRKLKRDSAHRKALLRNLNDSLINNERIITTEAKAKELRSYTERTITLAKRGGVNAHSLVTKRIFQKKTHQKVFTSLVKRFENRPGGYTRIIKLPPRPGDASRMAIIEFVDYELE